MIKKLLLPALKGLIANMAGFSGPRVLCLCLAAFFTGGCIGSVQTRPDVGYVRGVISDLESKPVENAQVYLYRWLHGQETIGEIIREEVDEGDIREDYGDYRGPADFKSAKTGADGRYEIALPPGIYCLVARKRQNQKILEGPLNPEDSSSLVSEPVTVEASGTAWVSLKLLNTLREASFFEKYLVRTYKTGFSGRVVSPTGLPVSGVIVTANEDGEKKVGRRPDFISLPTGVDGNYTLYVYYGGVYHPSVKRRALGGYLSFHPGTENKTATVSQGQITSGVDLILEE